MERLLQRRYEIKYRGRARGLSRLPRSLDNPRLLCYNRDAVCGWRQGYRAGAEMIGWILRFRVALAVVLLAAALFGAAVLLFGVQSSDATPGALEISLVPT